MPRRKYTGGYIGAALMKIEEGKEVTFCLENDNIIEGEITSCRDVAGHAREIIVDEYVIYVDVVETTDEFGGESREYSIYSDTENNVEVMYNWDANDGGFPDMTLEEIKEENVNDDEYGDTLEEAEELLEDFHKCAEEIEELVDMHSKVLYSRMTLQEYGKNIDRMEARNGGELALDKVF